MKNYYGLVGAPVKGSRALKLEERGLVEISDRENLDPDLYYIITWVIQDSIKDTDTKPRVNSSNRFMWKDYETYDSAMASGRCYCRMVPQHELILLYVNTPKEETNDN